MIIGKARKINGGMTKERNDMPKINQEEYEILKRLIEPLKEFKQYIARDEDGMLYAYRVKPRKSTNQKWVDGYQKVGVQIDLFQFIQWSDSEPYTIKELIDGYLDDEYGYFNMKLSREFEEFIKNRKRGDRSAKN